MEITLVFTDSEIWTLLDILAQKIENSFEQSEEYQEKLQKMYDNVQTAYDESGSTVHIPDWMKK